METPLPVAVDRPDVTQQEMAAIAAQTRTVLSAPVKLTFSGAAVSVRPKQMARLLDLPSGGETELGIDQKAATRRLRNLSRGVARPPRNADFAVNADGRVSVVPSRAGRTLDVAATSAALLEAASRTTNRTAALVVVERQPQTTTKEARALGIQRQFASYATLYSGTSDRIRNLQLAIGLLDGARIAPGATWSFNERVGPRTEERGFRSAPVIIDGEYEEGVGGGVSQVATTVFNAAWEAGIKIAERTAHALYISRYPTGRDATVNYPDVDLKLRNDTKRWIVLKAGYDESGIVVRVLGGGPERRVESIAGELETTGPPKVERIPDPTLFVGERVVVEDGEPSRSVRVERIVYLGDEVLYRESWYTGYRSEKKIVRVGTKPRPVTPPPTPPEDEDKPKDGDAARRWRRWRRRPPLAFDARDSLGQPGRHARRAQRVGVHAGVAGPAVRDDPRRVAGALDDVLEAEAGAADVGGADVDAQLVVEAHAAPVAHRGLGGSRVDALLHQALVAAGELAEIGDARDLEPDEIDRVVDDALRVGLVEAHGQVRGEAVAVHRAGTFAAPLVSKQPR